MDFKSDEDLMKQIMAGGGGAAAADIDDELAALEEEVGGNKKGDDDGLADLENELDDEEKGKTKPKQKKDALDDDLDALEKEGLDDVDVEEEEKKPQKKPEVKKEPPKPQPKKEVPKGPDLYPEKTEKMYHKIDNMTSLGALEKEKEMCDKIIEYKKKRGDDYDDWEMKKDNIDTRMNAITTNIEGGIWDLNKYKQEIMKQNKNEAKILLFLEKDPQLNEEQKKVVKARIEERRQIIDKELKQNIEEGGEEEEPKKEETKKEAPKKEEPKKDDIDLYPEKAEKMYHKVEKMSSLTTLEKEKEICDKIIEYKKKRGDDPFDWENKKDDIDTRIGYINTNIEGGIWDLNKYKQEILNQYKWESTIIQYMEKDPNLKEEQKKVLKARIEERRKLIDKEIKDSAQAEAEEEGGEEEKPKEEEKKKEEPKKEKEKEDKKKEIIETKKSLNPLFDVPKEKEGEEKERLNKIVIDRLNEYRAAIDYFQTNEMAEQRLDATQKAKLICVELKKIQDGKWKEVNEFKLPDPVTPEYIYGYSKEERNEKFKKIIMDYDKQRKEIMESMTKLIEDTKKLPSHLRKKAQPEVMKSLNEKKTRKTKIDQIINLLKEKFQDSWVPAPLFVEQDKEIKTEKINKDIPENTLRIIFGKTTYTKDQSMYLIVTHPEKNQQIKFDQKGPGNWENQFDWKYEKGDFKSLFRQKIHVEVFHNKWFKDKLKATFDMDLRELKDHIEFTKDFEIKQESGATGNTANVTFQVRTPCKDKEYLTETKSYLQIKKIFPGFKIKGGKNTEEAINFEVKTAKISPQDLSVSSGTPNTEQPKQSKPQANKPVAKPQGQGAKPKGKPAPGGKKPAQPSAPIDKSQFKPEELEDPDNPDCLQTLSVLQFKQKKYKDISDKIDGRTPRPLMQKIVKIGCKIKQLEEALGDDQVSPQDYSILLKATFEHDKKLAEYFKQTGNKEKFMLVQERLPLILKELEDLVKHMPK